MKNDAQPSLFNLVSTLHLVKEEFHSKAKEERSPYLKAILSGNGQRPVTEKETEPICSDREAALRYIRESRMLHKK